MKSGKKRKDDDDVWCSQKNYQFAIRLHYSDENANANESRTDHNDEKCFFTSSSTFRFGYADCHGHGWMDGWIMSDMGMGMAHGGL